MRGILLILAVLFELSLSGCPSLTKEVKEVIDEASPGDSEEKFMLVPSDDYSTKSDRPLYKVWYGTNRKSAYQTGSSKVFSDSRDQVLHYGTAIVYVPKSHEWGSTGSSWIGRIVKLTDDRLTIEEVTPLGEDQFKESLREVFKKKPVGHRRALVYIHGYNVTFEQAVIRAAQIGFDLKVDGITALFSWPSRGTVSGYAADEASIEISESFLREFLEKLALQSNIDEVDVIAHSMGNRAFLRAVQSLAPALRQAGKKFGQIILAAPDVDADLFKQLAAIYPSISTRTTLYSSSKDLAVWISAFWHQYNRAGFYPPLSVIEGIDTVQVTNVDVSLLGHDYYGSAPDVMHDIWMLLQGHPPHERPRLRPLPSLARPEYWEIAP